MKEWFKKQEKGIQFLVLIFGIMAILAIVNLIF